jgi:hypothetical protein
VPGFRSVAQSVQGLGHLVVHDWSSCHISRPISGLRTCTRKCNTVDILVGVDHTS